MDAAAHAPETQGTDARQAADSGRVGDNTAPQVAVVREILDYLGYFPEAVDGAGLADTGRALRTFQQQHGLPETGVIDQPVLRFFQHVRVPKSGAKGLIAAAAAAPTGMKTPLVTKPLETSPSASEQGDPGSNELVYTAGLEAHDKGDFKGARRHWLIAAEGGHREAQYRMAVLFDHGEGVVADAVSAAFWYRRAAENGHVRGQTNLGVMYRQGDGVTKDSQTALAWTERAARQGVARAQTNLALMLAGGEGTAVDYAQAYMWFATAAAQGNADARKGMTALQSLMTFGQLTEAKGLAKTFQPKVEG